MGQEMASLSIKELRVRDYRSIRRLNLPVSDLTIVVGKNGTGKSNLYRSLMLLAAAANGEFAKVMAAEGGMPSAMWAGPRMKGSVRMTLGITLDQWTYDIECGLPAPAEAALPFDPIVKSEMVGLRRHGKAPAAIMHRRGPSIMLRDHLGQPVHLPLQVLAAETALSVIRDPQHFPELAAIADTFRGWRFYHHFRTDPASPLRQPQVGVCTPTMGSDGTDLAAVLQSVITISDGFEIMEAVTEAFPGSRLEILEQGGRLEIGLQTCNLNRPLRVSELSDGTLRYLCLIGAFLSLRLPTLIVLNEPEMSLHPNLLKPLARLIHKGSQRTQVWVITHSELLTGYIEEYAGVRALQVSMKDGMTIVSGVPDE
jgi:predicted ATPase